MFVFVAEPRHPSEDSRRVFHQRSGGPPAHPGSPPCPSSPGSSPSGPLAALCPRPPLQFPLQILHMSTSLRMDVSPKAPPCHSYPEPPSPAAAAPPGEHHKGTKNRVKTLHGAHVYCKWPRTSIWSKGSIVCRVLSTEMFKNSKAGFCMYNPVPFVRKRFVVLIENCRTPPGKHCRTVCLVWMATRCRTLLQSRLLYLSGILNPGIRSLSTEMSLTSMKEFFTQYLVLLYVENTDRHFTHSFNVCVLSMA